MPASAGLLAQHNLTADEYQRILELLGLEPNLTELGHAGGVGLVGA
jgi:hypothetical protein